MSMMAKDQLVSITTVLAREGWLRDMVGKCAGVMALRRQGKGWSTYVLCSPQTLSQAAYA